MGLGMKHRIIVLAFCLHAVAAFPADADAPVITTGRLLEEMADLTQLASWPDPAYRTVQFSSYDRRSTTAEAPGWFSNADGFGREPIPGFLKVLREARDGQAGLYLLAEVTGPGAIVRGWSAGMGGTLRVYLDPPATGDRAGTLVWEGPAYDFLARRSSNYLRAAGLDLKADDAFIQQDADYLPIPFARGLRVTWEGRVGELHFYHLQVRLYAAGTQVRTFDAKQDLKSVEAHVTEAIARLTEPGSARGEPIALSGAIEPGRA